MLPRPFSAMVAAAWGVLALTALVRPAFAQCPDGTPPPCRGGTSAGGVTRRANPPLDQRTWIVVPFENVTRAQDIDWLREASVNLLYLDMSKWRDIRVIDDERVADLVRETPETHGGQAMSLQAGMAVARRAGAGQLVMGDLLKVGSRTRVVAKVFDVRSGQRVRNVIEETGSADSLMGIFGRLARGILNADPPSEAALGTIGTTRLDAYQEYLAGVQALNAFDLQVSRQHFERALQLDSAFALAHYKLTIVLGWESGASPGRRTHAEAAARLGGTLPARERGLINGLVAQARNDYFRACEIYAPMLRADSSDVEVLYNLGECSYHDNGVVPVEGDTSRFQFRTNWNTMLWAFRRVLALDPSYHLAFQHIQDALQAEARPGCLAAGGQTACGNGQNSFVAVVRRSGDSLLLVPVRQLDAAGYAAQVAQAQRDGSRRRNLEEARRAAEEWVAAGPNEGRARIAYAHALLRQGRVQDAAAAARQAAGAPTSRAEAGSFATDRIEIALKTDNGAEAHRIFDSARVLLDTVLGAQQLVGIMGAMLGHPARLDTAVERLLSRSPQAPPPWVMGFLRFEFRAQVGLADDSVLAR